jgi:hypothetical protein
MLDTVTNLLGSRAAVDEPFLVPRFLKLKRLRSLLAKWDQFRLNWIVYSTDLRRSPGYTLARRFIALRRLANIDASFKQRSLLDTHARSRDVTYRLSALKNLDPFAGVKITNHLTFDHYLPSVNTCLHSA